MKVTKRVRNCEVLRLVGSEEVAIYCHACGEIVGGATDWDFLSLYLLEILADEHEEDCPSWVGRVPMASS